MITREPAVSGQFYPASKSKLIEQLEGFINKDVQKKDVIAAILPHAGIIYSGSVAGATVSRIKTKDTIIIIGPNHTGLGKAFSIMTEGTWRTPMGNINIDSDLAGALSETSDYLENDLLAHRNEHSIEVELPFFQYFKNDFKIVPIIVSPDKKQVYEKIASDIVSAIKNASKENNVLIVASSDLTHYEPQQIAEKKDKEAINAILELDENKLLNKIKELNISMCGYVPAVIAIIAAKQLGAKSAELIKYQTSGDISGDYSAVVGYAGITIS